ncbi:MAG: D-glutamate deacylase [Candidatus Bathyarchaeota archaeon BA1]|nr:MAG: D-glutamate deacylase [Candidatus Bathyarchaeota archaeon BA1]
MWLFLDKLYWHRTLNTKDMLDIVIKNGSIVDGAGNPWFRTDIGVKAGRIFKIGRLSESQGEAVIDAKEEIVAPGFVDIHNHSDGSIIAEPMARSAVRQGVTTIVIGNCGSSLAPITDETLPMMRKEFDAIHEGFEIPWNWRSFSQYLDGLGHIHPSINVVPLVGHGMARTVVMGLEAGDPNTEELETMKKHVEQAMEAGAFGLSTGLIYAPGCFAKTEEIIELCKVVAEYGGIYASHIRSEGHALSEAVKEAISIGRKTGVSVQVSHHKAFGRKNWGKVKETLRLMENARKEGVEVTCDVYPYMAGMTSLSALLPPWAREGGRERTLERLRESGSYQEILRDLKWEAHTWENLLELAGPENIIISMSNKFKDYEGMSLSNIATIRDTDTFTAMLDVLLKDEALTDILVRGMHEDDVRTIIKHPLSMIGTDSWIAIPGVGKPHPRFYGTYPRILSRYVREQKLLRLEEAIRKMSSMPCQKLGLFDRGLIKEGFWADLVIIDQERVLDKATYDNPHQYPNGVEHVIVNGEIVVRDGEHTGKRPGRVLRRTGAKGIIR